MTRIWKGGPEITSELRKGKQEEKRLQKEERNWLGMDDNLAEERISVEDQVNYRQYVDFALSHMSQKERTIFEAQADGFTHEEIGTFIGVSGERARQIKTTCRARLKGEVRRKGIELEY